MSNTYLICYNITSYSIVENKITVVYNCKYINNLKFYCIIGLSYYSYVLELNDGFILATTNY